MAPVRFPVLARPEQPTERLHRSRSLAYLPNACGGFLWVLTKSCLSANDPVSVIPPALAPAILPRLGRQTIPRALSVKPTRSTCHRSAVAGSAGPQWLPSRSNLEASALSGRAIRASRRARAFSASPQHITPPLALKAVDKLYLIRLPCKHTPQGRLYRWQAAPFVYGKEGRFASNE